MRLDINQISKEIKKAIDGIMPYKEIIFIPIDNYEPLYYLNISGVYFLISKKKVIYVGMSSKLGSRLITHLGDDRYKHKITDIVIIRFPENYDLMGIEEDFIRYFNPPYNIMGSYFTYGKLINGSEFKGYIDSLKQNGIKKWPEKEGWGKPYLYTGYRAKKIHYYKDRKALCNGHGFYGDVNRLDKADINNPNNCKRCLKKIKKLESK